MSEILGRARTTMAGIESKLREQLDEKPLSRLLRRESWPDHERAQYSPFEMALAGGTIPRDAYANLLTQVLPVYRALEERMEQLKGDPVAGNVYFPELNRGDAVEADINFYMGAGWQDKAELLDVTREYMTRIMAVEPHQFVAHHYNRYLADLSGGLIIGGALKRAWGLDLDGLRYYHFDKIEDANAFKDTYRARLDGLPIDMDHKIEFIEEVMAAYEYNIEMTAILADRYLEPAEA